MGLSNCTRSFAYSTARSSVRAAAPTPSTTAATGQPVERRATAAAASPVPSRRLMAPSRSSRPSLRLPSTDSAPHRRTPVVSAGTAKTPNVPSGSVAVTQQEIGGFHVGHVHLRAGQQPAHPRAWRHRRARAMIPRAFLVQGDRADRRAVGQAGQGSACVRAPCPYRAPTRPRRSPTTRRARDTTRRRAPRARPRRRPCPSRHRRAPRARAVRARRDRAAPTTRDRRRAPRCRTVVRVADVTDGRLVGEETAHGIAQHLLVGRELEVHEALPLDACATACTSTDAIG